SVAGRQWTSLAADASCPYKQRVSYNGARRIWTGSQPFHGGESGSIPLGSANGFKDLVKRPQSTTFAIRCGRPCDLKRSSTSNGSARPSLGGLGNHSRCPCILCGIYFFLQLIFHHG